MNNLTTKNSVYDITIRLFILLLIIAWCLLIMYPFVSIILWSIILALAIYPLHQKLTQKIGGRAKLASFIIVFSILVIIFLPTWVLIDSLSDEIKDAKLSYDNGTLSIPPPTENVKDWPIVGEKLYDGWQNAHNNLQQTIANNRDQLADGASKLAKGILSAAGGVFQMMAALIIAGILLVIGTAGEGIRKFFRKIAGKNGDEFADITKTTVGNVVRGVLGVALIQSALIGFGLMLAGVPYAGVLTIVVFIFAVLQLPPTLIVIPVAIYLFSEKEILPAILWSVYLILAGLSDNFLKPILLGKGAPVPMLVIFIGVVGGFMFSGFIGLFTGAIVMSIGYKLFTGWINSADEVEKI
ncbi:MAG: AI-2E family transporter [Marinilabiliales bacterium]|nr:MAG: AI-2E family transporter [Marinilabiliales bacterium]